MREDASDAALDARLRTRCSRTRPTAVNLRWALDEMRAALRRLAPADRAAAAWTERAPDLRRGRRDLPRHRRARPARCSSALRRRGRPRAACNVLTHCNAGWLATVDWGTALAPIYLAHDAGIPVHVWVDETRPRNQGARADRLGARPARRAAHGDRRQRRRPPDAARPGRPRASSAPTGRPRTGDVCNKIGTYLKALAARDNGVPFYVALPSLDASTGPSTTGSAEIPIEERDGPRGHATSRGRDAGGGRSRSRLPPEPARPPTTPST